MVLGLKKGILQLHPYSDKWPRLFAEAKQELQKAVGNFVLDIQHVGSTSIPGLIAKPILDIGIAVEDFDEARRCVEPLESLGYEYRGENGIPRRHYFNLRDPKDRGVTLHHIHINEVGSHDWRAQIAFRDALRHCPNLRDAYATLKTDLLHSAAGSRLAYTNSKTGFITKVLLQQIPSMRPVVGDEITVRAFKADHHCYRHWQASIVDVTAHSVVTYADAGKPVWDIKGEWVTRSAIRAHYWFDKPYNVLEVFNAEGTIEELYINIGSPPSLWDGEIHFTDYELDVVRFPNEAAKIVDEDEFAQAAQKFGYTEGFQAFCYQAAQEAMKYAHAFDGF